MKYLDEKGKEIQEERWQWGVVYKDGSELHQFMGDKYHYFKEVDQKNVILFVMFNPSKQKRIDLSVEDGQIFHIYRNFIFEAMTPKERRVHCYGFGYKKDGRTAYHFILPDDRVIISDKDIDLTQFNV